MESVLTGEKNFWFALYIPTAMKEIRYERWTSLKHEQRANPSRHSWMLYMIFMGFCFLMSIVVFLFYPVSIAHCRWHLLPRRLPVMQESAGKTLEEMDFLFTKDRTPFTFLDHDAVKIGALFERDLAQGEALTVFGDGKGLV